MTQASEILRVSFEEWRREDEAFRVARAAATIPTREQEDYATYVVGLRLRVLEQCEVVRGLGGEEALRGFDCVRMSDQPRPVPIVPPARVLTDEEKRAALHASLTEIEGEIDEALLQRNQDLKEKAAARGAAGGSGEGASGGGRGGSGEKGDGSESGPSGQAGIRGDREASKGGAAGGFPGSSSTGPGASRQSGQDNGDADDVVARQLREAAEKERDPVLKEKLWAEYRKYKEAKR